MKNPAPILRSYYAPPLSSTAPRHGGTVATAEGRAGKGRGRARDRIGKGEDGEGGEGRGSIIKRVHNGGRKEKI